MFNMNYYRSKIHAKFLLQLNSEKKIHSELCDFTENNRNIREVSYFINV